MGNSPLGLSIPDLEEDATERCYDNPAVVEKIWVRNFLISWHFSFLRELRFYVFRKPRRTFSILRRLLVEDGKYSSSSNKVIYLTYTLVASWNVSLKVETDPRRFLKFVNNFCVSISRGK